MQRRNWLYGIVIFLLMTACVSEPEYPNTPAIFFENAFRSPGAIANLDSVTLAISFQDGDGDLGLSPTNASDMMPPFQDLNPDGTLNKFRNNIFVTLQVNRDGVFETVELPDGQGFDGRFPPLNTIDQETALEGTIRYRLGIFYGVFGSPINAGDQIRFEIQIADRSLNESNIIQTPVLEVGQP